MFELLSSLLKYIFTTIIYLFIFSIIRLIYLDIRSMNSQSRTSNGNFPYIKLINRRDSLDFKVEESYVLDNNRVIGRAMNSEISIADPFLSSRHARFLLKEGKYYLEDMGSTNGTYINSNRLGMIPVALKDGDKIRAGQMDFLFVSAKR